MDVTIPSLGIVKEFRIVAVITIDSPPRARPLISRDSFHPWDYFRSFYRDINKVTSVRAAFQTAQIAESRGFSRMRSCDTALSSRFNKMTQPRSRNRKGRYHGGDREREIREPSTFAISTVQDNCSRIVCQPGADLRIG